MQNIIQDIPQNQAFSANFHLPDSDSGETVTYSIIRVSDGNVFSSGDASNIGGEQWKVGFTPNNKDHYLVIVAWGDINYTKVYSTADAPKVNSAFNAVIYIQESSSDDTVTYNIYRSSDGQNLSSGNMSHVASGWWKVSYTPASAGTFAIEVFNSTLDVKYSIEIIATATSTTITSTTLLAQVEAAISARMSGGAVQSYSIGGRNLQYISLSELRQLRDDLRREVSAGAGGARNYARFDNPI